MNGKTINLFNSNGKALGPLIAIMSNAALKEQFFEMLTGVMLDPSTTNVMEQKHVLSLGYDSPLFCLNANSTLEFKLAVSTLTAALCAEDYNTVHTMLDECERVIMESVTLQRNTSSIH